MVYSGLHSYQERGRAITLFLNIFFVLFQHVEQVCKSFSKESLTRTSSHMHNVARVLSSPSRCFQLSTNLDRDFFRYINCYLWYCCRNKSNVVFHWFGINWHVFNRSECRNCCLYTIIQKIAPQAESGKYFQIWFSPDMGKKMGAFWACACKLSWTLLSPARVQPLYGAERKKSSGTGLSNGLQKRFGDIKKDTT